FNVDNAWTVTDLTVRVLRDDGAVMYLNGHELPRSNMPDGPIDYLTTTSNTSSETTFFEHSVDPTGMLVEGENVLAVEIHQTSRTSSDISFDLELVGETSTADLIETDLEAAMLGTNASALIRVPFTVNDPSDFSDLYLEVAYEDGYVAYLNGTRVAVRNAPVTPAWNSTALSDRPLPDAVQFQIVDLTAYLGLVQPGDNLLAVHAMNDSASDSTFFICPRLTALAGVTLTEGYYTTPTPGTANVPGVLGMVEDTKFSLDRGFFDAAFDLEITTETPGAEIRYTTNGSAPTATTGTRYTAPVHIDKTTIIRAAAYKPGYLSTDVDCQTYIFLDQIIDQPSNPAGFPTSWISTSADYEMDPDIVNNATFRATLKDDLLSIPTMSLVMDINDLFGSSGIYSNSTAQGVSWERPASLEYFVPDGTEEFQINCGMRMYGGVGRNASFKKHSFRAMFKGIYGPTKLRYALFGEDATDSFDTLILRSNFNDAWVWGGANVQFIRDEFAARLQLALGDASRHGNFVHLYVNGLYWGLYNPCERPDQSFSASYYGGEKENWDGINSGGATGESSTASWSTFVGFDNNYDLTSMADYQRFMGNNPDGTNNPAYTCYLDAENYINYLMMNFYVGNRDWPGHNWYAGCLRTPPQDSTGFKWYSWDAEWIVGMNSGVSENRTSISNSLCEAYAELRYNPEFRLLFGDLAHKAFFNGGPLTPMATSAVYQGLANEIEASVVAESARWGDVARSTPYTVYDWRSQRAWILYTYLPQRSSIVLNQLRSAGLYPDTVAPTFNIDGSYQHGGAISAGESLGISAPSGTIYYTLDG
ncbi:MAG: CotH kinase family protein, partial [Phycisphaerae bacterium]